jgi:hypothetical protein
MVSTATRMDPIILCSSDDEEENIPVQQALAPAALGKRKAEDQGRLVLDDDNSDVEEIPPPVATNGAGSSTGDLVEQDDHCEQEDEDVTFVGRTGDLALADFPHARENCAAVRFVPGQQHKHCANCYCYCCDKPASDCSDWSAHCKATHADPKWRQLREQLAKAGPAVPGPAAAGGGSGSSAAAARCITPASQLTPTHFFSLPKGGAARASWPCERILRETQQELRGVGARG